MRFRYFLNHIFHVHPKFRSSTIFSNIRCNNSVKKAYFKRTKSETLESQKSEKRYKKRSQKVKA